MDAIWEAVWVVSISSVMRGRRRLWGSFITSMEKDSGVLDKAN